MGAIELIETEVEGTKAFLEYHHQEPDLILHCREIDAFCNNLLPKEDDPTETAAEAQTQEEKEIPKEKEEKSEAEKEEEIADDDNIENVEYSAEESIEPLKPDLSNIVDNLKQTLTRLDSVQKDQESAEKDQETTQNDQDSVDHDEKQEQKEAS